MPKAMKKSSREQLTPPSEGHESIDTAEASGSDQDHYPDVSFPPRVPSNRCSYYVHAIYRGTKNELDG